MIKVCFIGAGFATDLQIRTLQKINNSSVKIVGICGKSTERATQLSKKYNIKNVFSNWEEALDSSDITAISICSPTLTHHEIIDRALDRDLDIICEKPLSGVALDTSCSIPSQVEQLRHSLSDLTRLSERITQKGSIFCYGENYVYLPALIRTQEILSKMPGQIIDIRAEQSHSGSHSEYARSWTLNGGGVIARLGSHPIGATIALKSWEGIRLNGKPIIPVSVLADSTSFKRNKDISCRMTKHISCDPIDVEDWGHLIITFSDGSKASITASDCLLGGGKNTIDIYTTAGAFKLKITQNDTLSVYSPEDTYLRDTYLVEKAETNSGWLFPTPDEDNQRGYLLQIQDFVEALTLRKQPKSGIDLAIKVMEVINTAYISILTEKRAYISE